MRVVECFIEVVMFVGVVGSWGRWVVRLRVWFGVWMRVVERDLDLFLGFFGEVVGDGEVDLVGLWGVVSYIKDKS